MKIIEGGIVTPIGFRAVGAHIGIKKYKKDLCLISSDVEAEFAGCFTKNIVKAAPVQWDMTLNEKGSKIKGIVINSGNANACTGEKGIEDNYAMAADFGACMDVEPEKILVCSTGVIGVPLPIDKIKDGIKNIYAGLGDSISDGLSAAEAIMTTDTFMKTISVEIVISGKTVKIGGMAKGSGMIHPNMATLLSFITTDADISREMLCKALGDSVDVTYNMISVDGDTSTNDTLLILANGLAGNARITDENEDYYIFKEALDFVNKKLATDIVRDGEGATKLMEVSVTGAKTEADARKLVKSVISSSLFKAALFGADANWGRVLCAMGYSGADFNPADVGIVFRSKGPDGSFNQIKLMDNGTPVIFDEETAERILSEKDIFIDILLAEGEASATGWGCDLTYDYVKINGDYRT